MSPAKTMRTWPPNNMCSAGVQKQYHCFGWSEHLQQLLGRSGIWSSGAPAAPFSPSSNWNYHGASSGPWNIRISGLRVNVKHHGSHTNVGKLTLNLWLAHWPEYNTSVASWVDPQRMSLPMKNTSMLHYNIAGAQLSVTGYERFVLVLNFWVNTIFQLSEINMKHFSHEICPGEWYGCLTGFIRLLFNLLLYLYTIFQI